MNPGEMDIPENGSVIKSIKIGNKTIVNKFI